MKITISEISRLTGVAPATLKKRLADIKTRKTPPKGGRGGGIYYESKEALRAVYITNGKPSASDSEKKSKAELEAELIEVKIQKEKINVATMERDLVPADAVRLRWGKIAAAFQRQALAFPDRVAQLLETAPDYKARVKIIKGEIEALLTVLSKANF